jgi:hypothetical protein
MHRNVTLHGRRYGDGHCIDLLQDFTCIRDRSRTGSSGYLLGATLVAIDHREKIGTGKSGQNPRVMASAAAGTNYGDAD